MSVPAKPGTSYPGRLEPVQQTWTRRRAHPPTGRSGGVNQSAIPYHFGGKEGVYLAVLEHVAGSIVAHLALPRRLLAGQTPAEALRTLMQDFVTALLGSETSAASSLLLAREQLQPSADFDALHTCLFSPLHHTVSELVTAIRSDQPDLKENILRAHAVLGGRCPSPSRARRYCEGWEKTRCRHRRSRRSPLWLARCQSPPRKAERGGVSYARRFLNIPRSATLLRKKATPKPSRV